MEVRRALVLVPLAGCHLAFGLEPTDPPPDVAVDVAVDQFVPETGCADGEREGFDLAAEPDLAGCSGAWAIPGVAAASTPTCAAAGDDSSNLQGDGCSIADLCAPGWHVCFDRVDVQGHSETPSNCSWEAANQLESQFFATQQPGSFSKCTDTGTDDLWGCGSLGEPVPPSANCAPLARLSANLCDQLEVVGGWACGNDYTAEAANVTKSSPLGGGALCCKGARIQ